MPRLGKNSNRQLKKIGHFNKKRHLRKRLHLFNTSGTSTSSSTQKGNAVASTTIWRFRRVSVSVSSTMLSRCSWQMASDQGSSHKKRWIITTPSDCSVILMRPAVSLNGGRAWCFAWTIKSTCILRKKPCRKRRRTRNTGSDSRSLLLSVPKWKKSSRPLPRLNRTGELLNRKRPSKKRTPWKRVGDHLPNMNL